MGCKNKNTYFNEVREEEKEERYGKEERERIDLFILFVGIIYLF